MPCNLDIFLLLTLMNESVYVCLTKNLQSKAFPLDFVVVGDVLNACIVQPDNRQ